jgi:hypothetical protein
MSKLTRFCIPTSEPKVILISIGACGAYIFIIKIQLYVRK